MRLRRAALVDGAMLCLALAMAGAGVRAIRVESSSTFARWMIPPRVQPRTWPSNDSLSRLEAMVLEIDPFHLPGTDAPSEPVQRPAPSTQGQSESQLALVGIVGGPPWTAILGGVAGRGTVVVHEGDALVQYRVHRIDEGKVELSVDGKAAALVLMLKSK